MAAACKQLFDQTVTILRPTASVDAAGAPASAYTTYLSSVPCRIQPMQGDEDLRAGSPASARTYRVYLDPSTDVQPSDRLAWTPATATAVTHTMHIAEPMIDFDGQGRLGRLVAIEMPNL